MKIIGFRKLPEKRRLFPETVHGKAKQVKDAIVRNCLPLEVGPNPVLSRIPFLSREE